MGRSSHAGTPKLKAIRCKTDRKLDPVPFRWCAKAKVTYRQWIGKVNIR